MRNVGYKGFDGFAPNFAYLGHEGYALGVDFREGSQHCQKRTPEFLADCIHRAQRIVGLPADGAADPAAPRLLLRLDSGNDSVANIDVAREGRDRLVDQAQFTPGNAGRMACIRQR